MRSHSHHPLTILEERIQKFHEMKRGYRIRDVEYFKELTKHIMKSVMSCGVVLILDSAQGML